MTTPLHLTDDELLSLTHLRQHDLPLRDVVNHTPVNFKEA